MKGVLFVWQEKLNARKITESPKFQDFNIYPNILHADADADANADADTDADAGGIAIALYTKVQAR